MIYSERLLEQGSFLTRLAHRRRYRRTLELAAGIRGAIAVDYGCGDGILLRRAYDQGIIQSGYGVDSDPEMRRSAAARFSGIDGFQFLDPTEVATIVPLNSCDLGLCTETLEHVTNPEQILDGLCQLCRPGAHIIVTVPIEVGPSLLGKQIGRYLAALRRPYGYESYNVRELVSAAIFWNARAFDSSHVHDEIALKGHKGFDYRDIGTALCARMNTEKPVFSPFPMAGPVLNSTVMWRCRVRERPPTY